MLEISKTLNTIISGLDLFNPNQLPKYTFLIKFKLVLNSSDNPFHINDNTNLLVYCAGGYRSALAGKTLLDLELNWLINDF